MTCACEMRDGEVSATCGAHSEFIRRLATETKTDAHAGQPIVTVAGVKRFRANAIVRYLLDASQIGRKTDLNDLALMPFSDEDRQQFAQLIGYSVSGYAELPYVTDEAYDRAVRRSS